MAEVLNNNDTTISHLIFEFDNHIKQLDGIKKELTTNLIPKSEPSAEYAIIIFITELIEVITTIFFYEKVLLHYIITMDDSLKKQHDYHNRNRIIRKSNKIGEYYIELQQNHKQITNRKALDLLEKTIEIIESSFDSLDKIVRFYEPKEDYDLSNKTISETIFESGERNGIGSVIFPDGEVYIGECMDGVPVGHGTVIYPDGSRYTGEIEGLIYKGYGTFIYSDGSKYIGDFRNDNFNGQGTFTDVEGYQYMGKWEDGVLISQEVGPGPYHHPVSGIKFPEQLAGMERIAITNYELTRPGLGISVGYNKADIKATIYLYDLGFQNSDNESHLDGMKETFQEALGDIYKLYESGAYDGVVKLTETRAPLGDSANSLEALSASFMISQYGGNHFSHLYVARHDRHFIKIRFTYSEINEMEGKKLLEMFSKEIGKLIFETAPE